MKKYEGYRHPRTTQERRYNGGRKDSKRSPDVEDSLARPGRRKHNLPSLYDDKYTKPQKCWKERRKYKYRSKPREHKTVILTSYQQKTFWRDWLISKGYYFVESRNYIWEGYRIIQTEYRFEWWE